MMFFRSLLILCPAACMLAQTPPPPAPAPAPAGQSTPVPKPNFGVNPAASAPKAPAVPPDRIVLTVGDITLTASQFDQLIDMLPEQSRAQARGPNRKQFADNLVQVLALSQEGKRRGLNQTPSFKLQSSFTEANYLAGVTFGQISKEAKVSEADARTYYEAHKQDWDSVSARHILIRFQGSQVPLKPGQKELTDAEALAKAQELRKRIAGGEDFATVAKAESDDTGSGANGGDLGTFHHGQMVPAFDAAAYALQPGQISEPIKTQFGYHVIKVEKRETKTFEEVRPEIERRMAPEQSKKALDELVKKTNAVYDPEFFNTAKQ
ncbi:MAG TPA: peptidylprolyl isomerase [Bryobacteraceae bacterium]|nr:peptidylprolyl isomerase [Bryobacteraceae bacterium]